LERHGLSELLDGTVEVALLHHGVGLLTAGLGHLLDLRHVAVGEPRLLGGRLHLFRARPRPAFVHGLSRLGVLLDAFLFGAHRNPVL
jgi:hypothetical protein